MSDFKKAIEEIRRLSELANKHGIQIELPTHDYMTLTGRLEDVTRFKPVFEDWFFQRKSFGLPQGEMSIFTSKPRDMPPRFIMDCDFAQLELRILSHWARSGRIAPGDFFYEHLWMIMPDPFEDRGEGGVE